MHFIYSGPAHKLLMAIEFLFKGAGMSEQILLQLAGVLILGIAIQWFAWRTRFPAILLLLAAINSPGA